VRHYKPVRVRVVHQGAVRVNVAHRHASGPRCVAVYVDLHSKYAEIGCLMSGDDCAPGVVLDANAETLHLARGHKRTEGTEISFPEYRGWQVFCADLARYTLAVCLVKEAKP